MSKNCNPARISIKIFLIGLVIVYGITLAKLINTIEGSDDKPLKESVPNGAPFNKTVKKQQSKKPYDPEILQRNKNSPIEITEFAHYEGGVIVTKIHGPHQLGLLQQSMCLLHHAYNKKVQYDIIVFSTLPVPENETDLVSIRETISPVNLKVVVDNDGLANEINKLSPIRRKNFLNRCNISSPEAIDWWSECYEEDVGMGKIRYNWQAEFRSLHIWNHEALKPYRYMMWIDTDGFCTQPWDRDPMAIAAKNDLAIYYANYPMGRAKFAQPKVMDVFGAYLCSSRKTNSGSMETSTNGECAGSQLWTIHGFHHITNLDFFRQDRVMHWLETMIGDCFLCRKYDDQLAVTVPTFMLAPEKSWDMYKTGHMPYIFHNNKFDGKRNKKAGGFRTLWKKNAESKFPDAWNQCKIVAGD